MERGEESQPTPEIQVELPETVGLSGTFERVYRDQRAELIRNGLGSCSPDHQRSSGHFAFLALLTGFE